MKLHKFNPFRFHASSVAAALSFAAPLAFLALGTGSAWGITETFTTSGTWTCPTGVTSIEVAVQGGGGGGGGGGSTSGYRGGGGGGGACAYNSALIVEPGVTYTVTIGAGGTAGTATGNGGAGVASSFSGGIISTFTANGGAGGLVGATSGASASGGTASGGAVNRLGGSGAPPKASASGGGGGGAGTTSNGGSTTTSTAGTGGTGSPAGGAGSSNANSVGGGSAGNAPGGGGAGAYRGSGGQVGYAGGKGQITITYINVKANNEDNLSLASSWTAFVPTGSVAEWNNVVTGTNTTSLGGDLTFSSIKISNPGGLVTINGANTLTLGADATDIDMTAATQDLTLNCPLSLGAANIWNVASGKTLTAGGGVSGAFSVTKQGTGTVTLSGTNDYTGNTVVSNGTLNITGTLSSPTSSLGYGSSASKTVVNVSNDMTLSTINGASTVNSFAVYNQTAGTVTSVGNAATTHVANGGGYGYLNLTGGTLSQTANRFSVTNSTGTAGGAGVVYVGGTGTLGLAGTTSMIIGYGGMPASLTVGPGGTVDRSTGTGSFWLTVNANAYGVLNVAGGDFNTAGSGIRVGNGATSGHAGFVNLAKGTLTLGLNGINGITGTNTGSLYSNYAGGTLKAANNLTAVVPATNGTLTSTSTVFGPTDNSTAVGNTSQDFAGGLTLDTNGNSVTYGSPLLGATGNGVKQSNLTVTGGSGYIGAPMVQFTGGTGTPAAGYALISGGAVTGIVITSPGAYSVDPSGVTLTGGGGTGASVALGGPLTANAPDSGLNKINSGTLTLAGANTYTGATLVSGGTLKSSTAGSATTDITVATSAAGGALVASNGGQWINTGDLTLNNNSTLVIDYGSTTPSTGVAPIAVDNFNVGTNLGLKIEAAVSSPLAISQTYPLVHWTTSGPPNGSAFTSILTHRLAGNFSVSGNTLFLTVTSNGAISWNTGNGTWDTVATTWVDGSLAATAYIDSLDAVRFGDATGATGNPIVTLNTALSPDGVTMNSTAHDYTISGSGSIGGNTSLTLDPANTRTLTLATANTYTGATAVNGGTLRLGDGGTDGSLAATGTVSIGTGATFAVNQSDTVTQGTDFSTTAISGAGGLAQTGSGTTILNAVNTYTGPTTISGGILQIGGAGRLGAGAYAGDIAISGGAALQYESTAAQTLSGIISGNGALTKSGVGILTLSGANSYSGATTISTGVLSLGHVNALQNTSGITIADGATLSTSTDAITIGAPITTGLATTTSTISFGRASAAAGSLTLNGAIGGGGNVSFSTPDVSSGGNVQTILIGAAGTYAGSTVISTPSTANSVTVKAGVANALPAATILTLSGGSGSGSGRTVAYDLGGFDQTLAGLTNNISTITARNQRINNTSLTPATLTINNTTDFAFGGLGIPSTFNGNPVNPSATIIGNLALTKSGAGVFTVSNTRGYSGNTTVTGGTLSLGGGNSANNASTVTIAATGAKLQLTYAGTDIVGALVIGSTTYGPGVYGHTDSGADNGGLGVGNLNAFFEAGSGTLTIQGGYASWTAGPFLGTLSNTSAAFDFDNGGLDTGIEWVVGGDPTDASDDAARTPTFDNTTDPDFFIFTYRRTDAASTDTNTTIKVEYGSDISGWTPATAGPDIIITPTNDFFGAGPGIDKVEVKIRRTLAVGGKLFARLNVAVGP